MQRIRDDQLRLVYKKVLEDVIKIRTGGTLIQPGFAKNEQGEELTNHELADWLTKLYWKSLMFDEMNQGFTAIEKATGEKIGPFATQTELANALNKSCVIISRYYTGFMVSKTYKFIREPYYKMDFSVAVGRPKANSSNEPQEIIFEEMEVEEK